MSEPRYIVAPTPKVFIPVEGGPPLEFIEEDTPIWDPNTGRPLPRLSYRKVEAKLIGGYRQGYGTFYIHEVPEEVR